MTRDNKSRYHFHAEEMGADAVGRFLWREFKPHNWSGEERVGSVELRTEECVSSLGDKTATDLCGEAEPEAFCGFLKPLDGDSPILSSWSRASP